MNRLRIIVMTMSFLFLSLTVEAQVGSNWTQVTSAAPWSARDGLAVVVFNGQMWVLGGGNGGGHNDVWSSSDGTNWTEVTAAAPWSPRSSHEAVVLNGQMWVLGGVNDNGNFLNDVWSSSDGTNWTQATPAAPWGVRYNFGLVAFNGRMWVLGGYGNGFYNDVWSSSDGTNWTQANPNASWSPRYGFGSVVLNGQMSVLGGYNFSGNFNDVWSSSDGTNWTEVTAAAPWSARYNFGSVVLNGRMWMLGGDVWSSSDATNWTQVTPAAPWSGRELFGSVVLNGQMWVLGGYNGSYLNDVWSTTPPPMASFSGSPTNGCAPLTVTFTDNSTGLITNRFWNFGDGGTTNLATNSVAYTYNTAGVYTVTEIVTGPGGASTNVQPNYIIVLNCPTITAITREGYNIRVTWNCIGGQSNVLQSTKAAAIASYTTNFADISPVIVVPGVGISTTNYLDAGVAYAPVLTPPTQVAPTSGVASTVNSSAQYTRGLADSLGNAVPVGGVLMLGSFSITEPAIQSNFFAGNVSAIMSNFTPYSTSFAVGEGIGLPATWEVSLSAAGFGGQQIYLLAIDKPTFAAATHLGIFTAPSWVFPAGGGTNTIDLEDVTDFVIGAQGGSLTINLPLSQTYTFDDTARLSVLPGRILFYRVRLVQ